MASGNFLKRWVIEFRDFAFSGNLIDLAVAFVIGGAFKDVITSVVTNLVTPIVTYGKTIGSKASDVPFDVMKWKVIGIGVGPLLNDLLNFVILAMAVFFIIVKPVNALTARMKPKTPETPAEPVNKECPFCLSVIPIKATRCAHCTSQLPATV